VILSFSLSIDGQTAFKKGKGMTVHYIEGDVLTAVSGAIAHVCNNRGGWGKGFSGNLSAKYPQVEEAYSYWFAKGYKSLGTIIPQQPVKGLYVFNMIAQDGHKSANNPTPLDYTALRICLNKVLDRCLQIGITQLHMPYIGTGLGGGNWNVIAEMLEEVFASGDVHVYIYAYETPEERDARQQAYFESDKRAEERNEAWFAFPGDRYPHVRDD
jgi:O-acetyl-ADP-ribose deacetylase (regulator of RNase III)